MLKPSIDKLLKLTKSKFILTQIVAKRATQIMLYESQTGNKKEIEQALEEIENNKIDYTLSS